MDTTEQIGTRVEPVGVHGNRGPDDSGLAPQTPATNGEQRPPPVAARASEPDVDPTKEAVEIILDYPVEFDGKRYERLTLNLIGLRRKQWKQIKRTFKGLDSSFNPMPLDDEDYQAIVAAEAAEVPLLLMDALDPRDWLRVSGTVFSFLGRSLDPRLTRPKR